MGEVGRAAVQAAVAEKVESAIWVLVATAVEVTQEAVQAEVEAKVVEDETTTGRGLVESVVVVTAVVATAGGQVVVLMEEEGQEVAG